MFDIKDLVSFPLRNGHEGVLRGHILTQVGLDSRQYIDGTRRSLDESIDTIRPQRSNEMKPVARFRSREIVAPSLLLLSNPMSFRNLNPRHTLLNSSQVSFYNRLRSGVLRKLGETITSITPTFVKPRETATQKHSHPHSRRNKKNVSPSTIIHPTNPIIHQSLQGNVDLILPPIRIAVYFVRGTRFSTRVTHSTLLRHTPSFIASIGIITTPSRTVIRVHIDLRWLLADFPRVCTSHSTTGIKTTRPAQLFKTTIFIAFDFCGNITRTSVVTTSHTSQDETLSYIFYR